MRSPRFFVAVLQGRGDALRLRKIARATAAADMSKT